MTTSLHRRTASPGGTTVRTVLRPAIPAPVRAVPPAGDNARSLTDKALSILDAFVAGKEVLTLTSVARRAGLPLSTTHRIVQELLTWGALERREDGGYCIGIRLWELGSLAPRGTQMRDMAFPYLGDLYEATHENVHLAVRDGLDVVYIDRLSGHGAVPVLSRAGGRFPLPATGVGVVLLAHAPADIQERVLAAPLERFTRFTVTDPHMLRRMLADVRRCGFAISAQQMTEDALSVAAPVFGAREQVIASLSVVVRLGTIDPTALVPAVRAAARGLSRTLGSASAMSTPAAAQRSPA